MNFLKETIEAIKQSGHEVKDVIFIGSEDREYQCTWKEFETLADIEYDEGFGASEIATDLIVVFKDKMTMWRGEYDGSEWWNFSLPYIKPKKDAKKITRLSIANTGEVGWCSLHEINKGD